MLIALLALSFQIAVAQSGSGTGLRNIERFAGTRGSTVDVQRCGDFLQHGMYFTPDPPCADLRSIRVLDFSWNAYEKAGGFKGIGVKATITGKIALRDVQTREGPAKRYVFSVEDLLNIKPKR